MRHVHTSGRQKIKSALWWLNGADHWTNIIALIQDHRRDEEDDFIWFIIEAILFLTTRLIQQKCDLFVHSCRGSLCRGSQRKSVRAWHCQTSSIITDPNSDPISSCLKSAHHICAYWTFRFLNTHTSRLTRQGQTDRATRRHKHTHTHTLQTSLTAYSSGETFSTSKTTASKLFFRSEEPLSLRDSELLLLWKTHSRIKDSRFKIQEVFIIPRRESVTGMMAVPIRIRLWSGDEVKYARFERWCWSTAENN